MTRTTTPAGSRTTDGRTSDEPVALLVAVVAWFALGVLELIAVTGTWPGREPAPGVEALRAEMGTQVIHTGGTVWPHLLGLGCVVVLLAGALLLLNGRGWIRGVVSVAGVLVIVLLGRVGRAEVAIGLALFVIGTVAMMTVSVHRRLSGRGDRQQGGG